DKPASVDDFESCEDGFRSLREPREDVRQTLSADVLATVGQTVRFEDHNVRVQTDDGSLYVEGGDGLEEARHTCDVSGAHVASSSRLVSPSTFRLGVGLSDLFDSAN